MSGYPPIQVVNEADEPIGQASMDEIHKKGLWHRVVVVIVKDPEGNILLQKRGPTVSTNPNIWDASAAGHVDEGEDYLMAAKRELYEEIGVQGAALTQVDYYRDTEIYDWRKLNRFKRVYLTVLPADTKFTINPDEVTEIRWFTTRELENLAETKPDEIVSDFVKLISRLDHENH